MRKALWALLLLASWSTASAQTATFTWIGDATAGASLSTIDNVPVDNAIGYGGAIQLTNGYMLGLLDLPEGLTDPPGAYNFPSFPNNGYLDCGTLLTFGAKQWGKRANGTTMDGTQAGDYYYYPASTSCPLWNGTTQISITEFRQFVLHRSCGHGHCSSWLVDTMESGFGTATVQ